MGQKRCGMEVGGLARRVLSTKPDLSLLLVSLRLPDHLGLSFYTWDYRPVRRRKDGTQIETFDGLVTPHKTRCVRKERITTLLTLS